MPSLCNSDHFLLPAKAICEKINHNLTITQNRNGGKLHPVEIKSASTFTPDFLTGIKRFQKVVGDEQCGSSAVIYNGDETFKVGGTRVFNLFRHGY